MNTSNLEHALAYLRRGWSVLPIHTVTNGRCSCGQKTCESPGKHPRIKWETYQRRLPTEDEVRGWFTRWPDSNIGCATGRVSGIVVLDIDGEIGLRSVDGRYLPPTVAVLTGGGGVHYFYEHPGELIRNFTGKLPGVDLRGDGGYVVLPPSVHKSGERYRWWEGLSINDVALASLPTWVRELAGASVSSDKEDDDDESWLAEALKGVKQGRRNDTLTRLAGHFAAHGMSMTSALAHLRAWNQRNSPPMEDSEIVKTVRSIYRREASKDARNFDVELIAKVQTDPPIYHVHVFGEEVVMTDAELISWNAFRRRVMAVCNRVPTIKSPSKWPEYVDKILQTKLVLLDTPSEASENEALWAIVRSYIRNVVSDDEVRLADPTPGAYDDGAWVFFSGDALRKHLKAAGERVRQERLWDLIRSKDGVSLTLWVTGRDGRKHQRRFWRIPRGLIFDADA